MKITFSNLGAIERTTLDLRPLTVIIGANNTNKTYIAYSLYGLWQVKYEELKEYPTGLKVSKKSPFRLKIKVDDRFCDKFINYFKKSIKNFKSELDTFFQDSTHKLFTKTNFEVEISHDEIRNAVNNLAVDESIPEFFNIHITVENSEIIIELVDTLQGISEDEYYDFQDDVLETLTFLIRYYLFRRPFLLPAERNAFIITYKMLANRRYKHLRQAQRRLIHRQSEERQLELLKEQGDIRYPQPIEDFLDFLTDVELEQSTNDSEAREKFCELANQIEGSIQGSNRTNFKPTKFGGQEIKIKVKRGLEIDLYNASSSIKQLAPLLLYLRYRAKENDLLIIDEPEMNLHPESQAKFLEVLGMLVNAGVDVLLTTHSPYFMSHLNNLISGDTNDENVRTEQAKSLYLGDANAFLKPEDVSAYEMRKDKSGSQTLHDLHDKDYGIRWDTLSDVSADIQQKFFEIYEKGEETSNGKKK